MPTAPHGVPPTQFRLLTASICSQNVREMLQRLLERHQAALQAATQAETALADGQNVASDAVPSAVMDSPTDHVPTVDASASGTSVPPPHLPKAVQQCQERRHRRLAG